MQESKVQSQFHILHTQYPTKHRMMKNHRLSSSEIFEFPMAEDEVDTFSLSSSLDCQPLLSLSPDSIVNLPSRQSSMNSSNHTQLKQRRKPKTIIRSVSLKTDPNIPIAQQDEIIEVVPQESHSLPSPKIGSIEDEGRRTSKPRREKGRFAGLADMWRRMQSPCPFCLDEDQGDAITYWPSL